MIRQFRFSSIWITGAILLLVGITVGSLTPPGEVPVDQIPNLDKLIHFSSYLFLSLYLCSLIKPSWLFYVGTFCLLWGLGIEFIQPYTHRDFEWWDVLANSLGVTAGILIGQKFSPLMYIEQKLGIK